MLFRSVGASTRPREQEGSYMPCFMVGQMVGEIVASLNGVPFYPLAHQSGHIAAALYGANRLELVDKKFISLHISGGTTECVLVEDLIGGKFKIISETLDLNAGQLVDRIGGMLDIEFPAGKELDKLAQGSTRTFKLKPTFKGNNPCISGAENMAKKMLSDGESHEDIAAFTIAFISAIVERMANDAIKETGVNTVLFAGHF